MEPHLIVIGRNAALADVDEYYILGQNVRGLPAVAGVRLLGIITLTDIRDVPRDEWGARTVSERMTPLERLVTTEPEARVDTVLQAMAEHAQ